MSHNIGSGFIPGGSLGTGMGTNTIASELTNMGTAYEGGYGSHQLQHGAGLGGIGTGMTTVSSNVSTNPSYLNQAGFAGTGIPTTTGGYAGNFTHSTGLNTGLGTSMGTGLGTGLGTGIGQTTLVETGYGTSTTSAFPSGFESGTGTTYPVTGTGVGHTTLVSAGQANVLETGLPTEKHQHHHHHHHNQGQVYEGGYGTHELQHGAGLGGMGTGMTTVSTNVSINPSYTNQTGFASTGIPTTTGGYVGTDLSSQGFASQQQFGTGLSTVNQLDKGFATQQFGTDFNSGLSTVNPFDKGLTTQQFGTSSNTGFSTLNSGAKTIVEEPHLSTMDKIKAKLHM